MEYNYSIFIIILYYNNLWSRSAFVHVEGA